MLFSEDRKFVFIAVPKTGTTAIQKRLQQIDPNIRRNEVRDKAGRLVQIPTHATARKIREVMGARAADFTFVAFVRDPRDVIISKYYFYRSGRAAKKQGLSGAYEGQQSKFQLTRIVRVLSAQLLPLHVWLRVYPYKSSAHFITDDLGAINVEKIGLYNRLQEDAQSIFSEFGYDSSDLVLNVENQTTYDRSKNQSSSISNIVERRLSQDCAIFDSALVEASKVMRKNGLKDT